MNTASGSGTQDLQREQLLLLEDVAAFYGRAQALWGVSLHVASAEIVGLLGRNGAGKSTPLKAILGLVRRRGRISFAGVELTKLPAERIPRLGIGYQPQGVRVFPELSVRENLQLIGADDEAIARVLALFPELRDKLSQRAGTLSGGERQLLALARAVVHRPKLLLLDEPSEGLMPALVTRLATLLRKLRNEGTAILLAEQRLPLVLELCDRVYLLDRGRIAWSGTPQALSSEKLQVHLGA